MANQPSQPPKKYAVALFPGFQALDVFGPLDMLNSFSKSYPLELCLLSTTLDPVGTNEGLPDFSIGQSLVPTHTYADCPDDIEVLLVPGGRGTRNPEVTGPVVEFVRSWHPKLRYLLTVCTGSAAVAMSGVLDGKRATSNKRGWEWVVTQGTNVQWVRRARWVSDGNIWTSSGISAGTDMMLAFLADQHGESVAAELATIAEYIRNTDPNVDPFA